MLGELDDGRPHSAGAAVNQDCLARLEAADRHQRLPCGQGDDRQGGRLSQRDTPGCGGEGVGIDYDELGPGPHRHHAGVAVDLIADGEPCDLRADGDHLTAQLPSHHLGQVEPEDGLELTGAGALIGVIDAGGDHPHQDLMGSGLGNGHVDGTQRVAVLLQDEGLHVVSFLCRSTRLLVALCYHSRKTICFPVTECNYHGRRAR